MSFTFTPHAYHGIERKYPKYQGTSKVRIQRIESARPHSARATSATCCRAFALLILRVVPMLSLVLTASSSDAASVEVSDVLELGRFSPGYFALTPHLPFLWPRWPRETVGLGDIWDTASLKIL